MIGVSHFMESSKFEELEELCRQEGMLHVLSYLSRRDCTVGFHGELKSDDLSHFYSKERLIRTEISTLQGLILKHGYNTTPIETPSLKLLVDNSERILFEIHEELKPSFKIKPFNKKTKPTFEDLFSQQNSIREYIFYSAEQAFDFQFVDLAKIRYKYDAEWLQENMGFNINEVCLIFSAITKTLNSNIQKMIKNGDRKAEFKSYLEVNEITISELTSITELSENKIISFLKAFSANTEDGNNTFNYIDDFNIVNARPIVKVKNRFFIFQITSLAQSIYESPIFWMRPDKTYADISVKNRGKFTEEFSYSKLVDIFGKDNVFTNINIFKNAATGIGEIDVLVKFGSKFLIIQAKSKSMTIPSRKGQVELLKDDFAKGFQNAYDQALDCANALMSDDVVLKNSVGDIINLDVKPSKCYPICLTSESYPALTFQCRQYLKYEKRGNLNPPFIMDVFFLDILTEFLKSPLLLTSYIDRRSNYIEPIFASTEIVLLSMHLKQNLWVDESKFNYMHLEDDIAADLDAAFMVRRLGLPGEDTPSGILQRYSKGFISHLLNKIEQTKNDKLVDLALVLLKANGRFLDTIDNAVSKISYSALQDGKNHDFSIFLDKENGGITIHTLLGTSEARRDRLSKHVDLRKYSAKTDRWTGIIINPKNGLITEMYHVNDKWDKNPEMEKTIRELKIKPHSNTNLNNIKETLKFKLGRNDKCLCGSGKKYKNCCL